MVLVPVVSAFASPELSIKATVAADELQVADAVRSCVLLSLNTPVAVNCTLPLMPTTGSAGVTTIEVTVAGVTVSRAVAESEPYVTVIVVWPAPIPVARPLAFTPAAAGVD